MWKGVASEPRMIAAFWQGCQIVALRFIIFNFLVIFHFLFYLPFFVIYQYLGFQVDAIYCARSKIELSESVAFNTSECQIYLLTYKP
jgi:hypothetical protein